MSIHVETYQVTSQDSSLRFLAPIGRVLFAAIFLMSVPNLFTESGMAYAATKGLPQPAMLVPLAGLLALIGGLSVLFGYKARFGALVLALFLVPVTLIMHRFWDVPAAQMQMELVNFMKNLALLGGTALIGYFGAGPVSLDARSVTVMRRRAIL